VSLAETTQSIEMPLGQTPVGTKNHALGKGALWCHLANTIQRSVHGDDSALYQTTLTIYHL